MTPTPTFTPTRAEIITALKHIRYEIEALLQTPKHDPDDESIVETVYFRKMTHARALHIFYNANFTSVQRRCPFGRLFIRGGAALQSRCGSKATRPIQ